MRFVSLSTWMNLTEKLILVYAGDFAQSEVWWDKLCVSQHVWQENPFRMVLQCFALSGKWDNDQVRNTTKPCTKPCAPWVQLRWSVDLRLQAKLHGRIALLDGRWWHLEQEFDTRKIHCLCSLAVSRCIFYHCSRSCLLLIVIRPDQFWWFLNLDFFVEQNMTKCLFGDMFPTSHQFSLHNRLTDSRPRQLQLRQLSSWRGRAEGALRVASQYSLSNGQRIQHTGQALGTSDQQIWVSFCMFLSFQQCRILPKCTTPPKSGGYADTHPGCWNHEDRVGMVQCLTVRARSTAALPSIRRRNSQAWGAEGQGRGQIILQRVCWGSDSQMSSIRVVNSVSHPAAPCKALWCCEILWAHEYLLSHVGSMVHGSKTRGNFETDAPPQSDHPGQHVEVIGVLVMCQNSTPKLSQTFGMWPSPSQCDRW